MPPPPSQAVGVASASHIFSPLCYLFLHHKTHKPTASPFHNQTRSHSDPLYSNLQTAKPIHKSNPRITKSATVASALTVNPDAVVNPGVSTVATSIPAQPAVIFSALYFFSLSDQFQAPPLLPSPPCPEASPSPPPTAPSLLLARVITQATAQIGAAQFTSP
ncbi:hypothetical protein M0R45_002610 [Rubus argutus]|uniref:Uncharacterized protein n=1 Tax=Rubus argutus TaxID=59490 RepID=A0AAW1VMM8_RUBAR